MDGVVIRTDRVAVPGPTGADLWWSWPLWVSDVWPGREHDMTCVRAHGVTDALAEIRDALSGLADLGYEGAADVLRVPVKQTNGMRLTDDQKTYNKLLCGVRGIGERANALVIVRFKALRRVSLDPWRIGTIVAAALVLLHHENDRTS